MQNTVYHTPPTFHPLLSPLQTAIDECEEMFTRLDFTLAQATAALSVIDDRLFDCVSGDMHVLMPACPGERYHSYVEAAGAAFALEERAALVPDYCDRCDGFHLVLERAVSAEGFGVD
jgi:hypothetical protein